MKKKEEEKGIITPHDLPSREEAMRENIEWWSKTHPASEDQDYKETAGAFEEDGDSECGEVS